MLCSKCKSANLLTLGIVFIRLKNLVLKRLMSNSVLLRGISGVVFDVLPSSLLLLLLLLLSTGDRWAFFPSSCDDDDGR